MNINNTKLLRYVAVGLFGVLLLKALFNFAFDIFNILYLVSLGLIIAGLLTQKYILIAAGAGTRMLSNVLSFFSNSQFVSSMLEGGYFKGYEILIMVCSTLFYGISYAMLIPAVYSRNKAKTFGIAAAALYIATNLLSIILGPYMFDFMSFVVCLIQCAALLITGMLLQENGTASQFVSNMVPSVAISSTSDKLEKITRLKALVDSGVISQEDFEAKKKQLLGL